MRKQKKQLFIMVILLILGGLAYVGVCIYNNRQEEEQTAEEEQNRITVTDFDSEAVTGLSYEYEGNLLEFVKEDGTWYYKEDKGIRLDNDQIQSMIDQISSLTADSKMADYDNLADYGLKEPENVISISLGEEVIRLMLGDKNMILGQYYVKEKEEDAVYLISVSLDTLFGKSLEELTVSEEAETEHAP